MQRCLLFFSYSAAYLPTILPGARTVKVAVQLEAATGDPPRVDYRWDADTDILIAQLNGPTTHVGMSGSVELEGSDGSWLVFDVSQGRIRAVEVAVWPDVHKRATLSPPATIEDALVVIPSRASQPGIASLEIDTTLTAEADESESVIHFRLGWKREVRTVRIGRDVLLEIDSQSHVAGVWFLNVPPFPST